MDKNDINKIEHEILLRHSSLDEANKSLNKVLRIINKIKKESIRHERERIIENKDIISQQITD